MTFFVMVYLCWLMISPSFIHKSLCYSLSAQIACRLCQDTPPPAPPHITPTPPSSTAEGDKLKSAATCAWLCRFHKRCDFWRAEPTSCRGTSPSESTQILTTAKALPHPCRHLTASRGFQEMVRPGTRSSTLQRGTLRFREVPRLTGARIWFQGVQSQRGPASCPGCLNLSLRGKSQPWRCGSELWDLWVRVRDCIFAFGVLKVLLWKCNFISPGEGISSSP